MSMSGFVKSTYNLPLATDSTYLPIEDEMTVCGPKRLTADPGAAFRVDTAP